MQITLQLAPELQDQLASEAQARGIALDRYIAVKLGQSDSRSLAEQHAIEQAINELRILRKGNTLGGLTIKALIEEGRKH